MDSDAAFLSELAALLKKYKADISFTCSSGSDTHGLYDDGMSISINDRQIYRSYDWHLDAHSLNER